MFSFEDLMRVRTVRPFRVPDVGVVTVEIGDGFTLGTGYFCPAYRVSIGARLVWSGTDVAFPPDRCTDNVDAMLTVIQRRVSQDQPELRRWVAGRRAFRFDMRENGMLGNWRARAVHEANIAQAWHDY